MVIVLQLMCKITITYGDRAFSVAAPRLWNQLPLHIKNSESVNQFKSLLKTHLFENFFNFK